MYFYDSTYILVIIGALLSLMASGMVQSTYAKYSRVKSISGMTGAQAARRILESEGIYDVRIEHISGNLTDNYNPRSKVLSLSDSVINSTSVAAIGVAAHECGHAIQHERGYVPLKLRSMFVPVASFGSRFSWILIILGMLLSFNTFLINVGIILFLFTVIFQLITLPVEFNASNRAVKILSGSGMLYGDEVIGTKRVLRAAALTYVAAAAASILQLLRLLLLFRNRND